MPGKSFGALSSAPKVSSEVEGVLGGLCPAGLLGKCLYH